MSTRHYNWPEIPPGAIPDVPYHVNRIVESIDSTMDSVAAAGRQTRAVAETAVDSGLKAVSSAARAAASAEAVEDNLLPRVQNIETLAGLAPGEVTDAQTANLISQPDTLSRVALNNASVQALGPSLDEKLDKDEAAAVYATTSSVTTELTARAQPVVADIIATDPRVAQAAADLAQSDAGLLRGRSSVLAEGTSLDTLTEPGRWIRNAVTGNTTALGYPYEGWQGHIEVIGSSATYLTQRATAIGAQAPEAGSLIGGRVFERVKYGTTWSDWREVILKGTPGSGDITGHGSPEGIITATVGTGYTDLDATAGASRWVKTTTAGSNTGWRVVGKIRKAAPARPAPGPHVVLRFDDGYLNNLTNAVPIMAEYDMPGVLFTGTDPVQWLSKPHHQSGYMMLTPAQILHMHNDLGWEIGSHSTQHFDAVGNFTSTGLLARDLTLSIKHLTDMGLPYPKSYAYPYGTHNATTDRAAYRLFDHIGLTGSTNRIMSRHDQPNIFYGWRAMGSLTSIPWPRLFDMAKTYISTSFDQGLIPTLGFHAVVENATRASVDISVAHFRQIIDWIAAEGYPVGTYSTLPRHNLLTDPGLERYPVNRTEDGAYPWEKTGGRAPQWERVLDPTADPFGGDYIMRLDASAGISAADATAFSQRIPVTPGKTYKTTIRTRQTAWTAGRCRYNVYFHDFLGNEVGSEIGLIEGLTSTASTFGERPITSFTVPANATTAQIHIQSSSAEGYQGITEISWMTVFEDGLYDPFSA